MYKCNVGCGDIKSVNYGISSQEANSSRLKPTEIWLHYYMVSTAEENGNKNKQNGSGSEKNPLYSWKARLKYGKVTTQGSKAFNVEIT